MQTFTPTTDAVGGSVMWTALVSLIPLLTFFIMLVGFKAKAHIAGACALIAAIAIAIFAMSMPAGYALLAATEGAVFGAHPVLFIVISAIWLYQVTVISGRFEDLRSIFDQIGQGDVRVQALLIAFCFGGLLEALAGFGAPVAITATMVMALGIKPLRAACAVLLANTAPVAYGAVAIPITTAGRLTGIDPAHIGAIVGRQAPLLALIVPFILLWIMDGRRGLKDAWPVGLVVALSFSGSQYWCSNHFSYELTDIVASLTGLAAAVIFMRFWKPRGGDEARKRLDIKPSVPASALGTSRTLLALAPYVLVIVVFGAAKLGSHLPAWLASTDIKIPWPIISEAIVDASGKPLGSTTYTLSWLSSPGTLLIITGLLVAVLYAIAGKKDEQFRLHFGNAIVEYGRVIYRMRWAALTIMLVLALAYVMNLSGQTTSIGVWMAGTGAAYAFISPILGWIGTAVTGSDTSANALFAKLQQTAALNAGIDPSLTVAANTAGGVVGKLISPQNLAIAATAAGIPNQESAILRKVMGWSVLLLLILCCLVYLQSGILAGMLPVQ